MDSKPLYLIFLIILVLFAVGLGLWFGNALGSGEITKRLRWKNINRYLRKKLGRFLAYLWRRRKQSKKEE